MMHQRVVILGLAALLPTVILAIVLAVFTFTQQQERMWENAVGLADRLLGEIEDEFRLHVGLLQVLARSPSLDAQNLDLALLNIVTNARDAMPDGGTLTIAMKRGPLGPIGEGQGIVVTIADSGGGIPPEALPHVFEPFFTTKDPGRGTGLGLAQVHGFATASRGRAEVTSETVRGTTVTIHLPEERVVRTAAVPSASAPAPESLVNGGRLLLVEDNEEIRTATAEYLAHAGWTVTEAPDAILGRRLLEAEAGAIDMLVSDIVMPGAIDGVALAQEVQRRWPRVPVLLVSGYSASAGAALELDVEVLAKPYEFSALEAAIERARRRVLVAAPAPSATAS